MATSTKSSPSPAKAATADRELAEIRKDLASVVKQLDSLRKAVAACEECCKTAPAASVDTTQFVSKRDWSVWKAKVAKKIGLRP